MYFTIRKKQEGKYWWRAVGDNNEIMTASQLLNSKQACIEVVRGEASDVPVHDKTSQVTKR
ncbi:MAG: hypothetical protein LH645_00050 [Actinomycetia bacterium]|nr:hypothetical protein [Actinomycetes bacterium]